MEKEFKYLKDDVEYSLKHSNLKKIYKELENIKDPTLVVGVGGSHVVSEFASKVLSETNQMITRNAEPRDLLYLNMSVFKNVFVCSYGGRNYGVEIAFLNELKHYLLSAQKKDREDIHNITYQIEKPSNSFISLSATLIPCTILLGYYLSFTNISIQDILDSYLKEYLYTFDTNGDVYEIFSGIDTSTSSHFLESTMMESGIGIPIVHDKYDYCHGRSTLSKNRYHHAIYFDTGTELDQLLLQELPKYYQEVIVIPIESSIIGDYVGLIKSMYLTKYLAESKQKDLSHVDYSPIAKKIYKYKGQL